MVLVGERDQTEERHGRRGLWLAPSWDGMVAIGGLLEAEAGQTLVAAVAPLARPTNAADTRSGGQRRADALTELPAAAWRVVGCPDRRSGPQLLVTVDLDSLVGRPGASAGKLGGGGPRDPRPAGGWLVLGR